MASQLEALTQLIKKSKSTTAFLEVLKAEEELRLLRDAKAEISVLTKKELEVTGLRNFYRELAEQAKIESHI